MIPVISSPCEAAREQADACHHDPRLGAGDACLEILGKATVASEPSEGAFDEPSVSVTTWRLRPFTFLAMSNPRGPPLSVVFTLWLSMMPADGVGLRPTA